MVIVAAVERSYNLFDALTVGTSGSFVMLAGNVIWFTRTKLPANAPPNVAAAEVVGLPLPTGAVTNAALADEHVTPVGMPLKPGIVPSSASVQLATVVEVLPIPLDDNLGITLAAGYTMKLMSS